MRSFTCAVAATLALSPIVWLHYLVVLLVPMAIARPRFSPLWLLPGAPVGEPEARAMRRESQTVFPALAAAILLVILLVRPRPAAERRGRGGRRVSGRANGALGMSRILSTALLVAGAAVLVGRALLGRGPGASSGTTSG